jgi:hypothetical protein
LQPCELRVEKSDITVFITDGGQAMKEAVMDSIATLVDGHVPEVRGMHSTLFHGLGR